MESSGGAPVRSWSWEVPAFEGRASSVAADEDDEEDIRIVAQAAKSFHVSVNSFMSRRLSLPAHLPCDKRDFSLEVANRLFKLRDELVTTRSEFLDIRQEASDLQEYSSAKLSRVTRYLGVLADKTRKFDRIVADYEHRLAVLRKEKSFHFNELVASKGNVRVVVRARPPLGEETVTEISFPDECTIFINRAGQMASRLPTSEFRFDQVYDSRVSQGEFFQDIQPLVQSALDGYNVSVFACGAKGSGKTYTLEGPSHDRGIYFRVFEELFDLSNGESTPSSKFTFYVTMLQASNDQIEDMLLSVPTETGRQPDKVRMDSSLELVRLEVANPSDFARIFKAGAQNQHKLGDTSPPCLIVTFHVHYSNTSTGEKQYSKLSVVDLPGKEQNMTPDGVSSSFSSLVEVLSAVISKRNQVQSNSSKIIQALADSIGGDSKTLVILNISPSDSELDLTKAWLRMAKLCNDSSRTLQNKIYEEQYKELKQEAEKLKKSLKASEEQCAMLSKELQRPGKVPAEDSDRSKFEKDQIAQLKTQVAQFAKYDRDQKAELANRASKILALEDKLQELMHQLAHVTSTKDAQPTKHVRTTSNINGTLDHNFSEELAKRDELIERLHEENEKLFQRLTERGTFSPRIRQPEAPPVDNFDLSGSAKDTVAKRAESPSPRNKLPPAKKNNNRNLEPTVTNALQKANSKATPAGEYLINALMDFDPDLYQGSAAVADAANKLLMLVLAAVIKAGASREHDMLEEIRAAVFSFMRKLEPRKLMDTMLVSRVRILYVRSLIAKSPELQALKIPSVEKFFEKVGSKSARTSSNGSSPTRSPLSSHMQSGLRRDPLDEHFPTFKVNLKQDKASKLSSIVLKLRGIDQETWRQHLTGAKLREMTDEARNFAIGNKKLAALFVHTPAGELQRQIRVWLAENFEFLSMTGGENASSALGQLDLLSTAIMDGWMAGLGIPTRPSTDALGQLLSEYTKHVYMSQLQHLKDVAATLATEEAEDLAQVTKVRSALEAIDHKRRKILQQMRNDPALLTKEEGGSPLRCPSTASEEARIASLISLEDICNQAEEIRKEAPQKPSRAKFLLSRLDSLTEQISALLSIDHPCANKFIKAARRAVEVPTAPTTDRRQWPRTSLDEPSELSSSSGDWNTNNENLRTQAANEVVQWSVLQFNNGTDTPFIIKCGATSQMQLVIKAQSGRRSSNSSDDSSRELVAVVPSPSSLVGLTLEEIKQALQPLPESFRQLAMARTADGTRARYARLYKTLAVRVPALRSSVSDLETATTASKVPLKQHTRRASDSDNFLSDYY